MLLTAFWSLSLYNSCTTTIVITCLADKLCTYCSNILWRRVLNEYQYMRSIHIKRKKWIEFSFWVGGRSGSSEHRGLHLIRLSSSLPLTIANEPKAPQVSMYEYKQPDKITLHLVIGSKFTSIPTQHLPFLFATVIQQGKWEGALVSLKFCVPTFFLLQSANLWNVNFILPWWQIR